jgi:hypothetical protein
LSNFSFTFSNFIFYFFDFFIYRPSSFSTGITMPTSIQWDFLDAPNKVSWDPASVDARLITSSFPNLPNYQWMRRVNKAQPNGPTVFSGGGVGGGDDARGGGDGDGDGVSVSDGGDAEGGSKRGRGGLVAASDSQWCVWLVAGAFVCLVGWLVGCLFVCLFVFLFFVFVFWYFGSLVVRWSCGITTTETDARSTSTNIATPNSSRFTVGLTTPSHRCCYTSFTALARRSLTFFPHTLHVVAL